MTKQKDNPLRCPDCGIFRGRRGRCVECQRANSKAYRKKNIVKYRAYSRAYYKVHKEERNAYSRACYRRKKEAKE